MAEDTTEAGGLASADDREPAKSEHGRTAVVVLATGEAKWLPVREAHGLVEAGEARRAAPHDLRVAGLPEAAPEPAAD